MFKKVTVVTALSTALLFGGALQNSVDASANSDQSQNHVVKTYYTMNGGWNLSSDHNFNQFLKDYFKKNNSKQEKADKNESKAPAKQQTTDKAEEVKQEQPQQQTQKPAEQPAKTDKQESQSGLSQLSQYEQQVVDLTNQEREKQGLSPLKVDKELSRVAREKSNDMMTNQYFSHNSPTYGSPFDMMKSYGISYRTAGENIAKGQQTPEAVVNAWMNSEGHRANILNANYTHIGVGYVEQGSHWTQQFIGK